MRRVIDWPRRGDVTVQVPRSGLLQASGAPFEVADVTQVTARLFAAGTAEPPVPLAGRVPVVLTRHVPSDTWVASLEYGADLDGLTGARVVVLATVDGRPQCVLDAAVRFVQADGR